MFPPSKTRFFLGANAPINQCIRPSVMLQTLYGVERVTLSSASPVSPPKIDVGYLSHPYDRRGAIEGLCAAINFSEALHQAPIIRNCWETGGFWYFHAINSPKGLCRVFTEHIQRLFCPQHCEMRIFDQVVSPYWCAGAAEEIERKIEEEERYKDQLKEVFSAEVILPKALDGTDTIMAV